jgi:Nucleoside-diphosphate-sugar epimerases
VKILILGGTVFLGRHLVEAALRRGHEVTLFHRGEHEANFSATIEQLRGDRRGNLTALQNRQWDVVIDTNGYVPSLVQASAQLLADAVKQYIFISSISVYSDFSVVGMDESAPVGTLAEAQLREAEQLIPSPNGVIAQAYGAMYGPLKARCEQVIEETMPGRALSIRPGLIVGPYDYSDRFTYWTARVARGGEILAPGRPDRSIQLIDARDMAEWIIRMGETGQRGIYNATGPADPLSMQRLLETCKTVTGSDATFTWLNDAFLLERGAVPWSQLPLWLPEEDRDIRGFLSVNIQKALSAGLTFRPLAETIQDTLTWDALRPVDEKRRAGLEPEQEAQLLQSWHHELQQPAK